MIKVKPNEDPDQKMSEHIDSGCRMHSMKAKEKPNACSYPSCTQVELIPITCEVCKKKFCLKHRFPGDHNCLKKSMKPPQTRHNANIKRNDKNNNDCTIL